MESEFKDGQWVYYDSGISKCIAKYRGVNSSNGVITDEYYQVRNSDGSLMCFGEDNNILWASQIRPATEEEVLKILKSAAKFKGFVDGATYWYPGKSILGERTLQYPLHCEDDGEGNMLQLCDSKNNVIYDYEGWAKVKKTN